MHADIELAIRRFLAESFPRVGTATELGADTSLVEGGLVDSLGVVAMVTFLEEEFGIVISDDEVLPEHLDTVARMRDFVARKLG